MTDALGLIGTTIAEKYAIESVVGEGGFAVVYRAQHTVWKRPVAVKVFKALGDVAAKDRAKLLEDFIQEGALLADLSERSSAICQARDVGMLTCGKGEQVPYMVLEWLEGQPLDAVIENERSRNAPLRSLVEVVRLLDPAAEALALAHKKGIAHRDVKPANVFVLGDPLGEDVSVKLLDFGIAKVVIDAQKMGFGKTAGHITSFTPSYGAPEQFNRTHGSTGPWTDVFALALVASELLTGKDALDGETLVQLAFSASDTTKRPTPRTLGATIPDDVEAVFVKALSVTPDDRYATAGEFWNALRMVVVGRPLAAIASVRSEEVVPSTITSPPAASSERAASPTAITAPAPDSALAKSMPSTMLSATTEKPVHDKKPVPMSALAVLFVVLAGGAYAGVSTIVGKDKPQPPAPAPAPVRAPATSASAAPSAKPLAGCAPGMLAIKGGNFFMGSDEKDAESNEKPAHKVMLQAYCLDELEVTVEQFKACSDTGACLRAAKENRWEEAHPIKPGQQKIYDPLCNINEPVAKAKHPINCVDWSQATQYCVERGARLPTEAEWELAARGTDGRIYPWGDDRPSAQLLNACGSECVAWMKEHPDPDAPIAAMFEDDDRWPTTAPVGSFPKGKSFWGVQDMVGNVWEWVGDWYADYGPNLTNTVQTNPPGPSAGTSRIIRGGSWNGTVPSWVRPSFRFSTAPGVRSYGIGFRCAKTL